MGPTQTPTPNVPTPGAAPGAISQPSPTSVQPAGTPPSFGGFVPPKPHGDIILEPEKPQKKSHLKPIVIIIFILITIISGIAIWLLISSRSNNSTNSSTSSSSTSSLFTAQTDFIGFTKQIIYENTDSVDTPNLDIDIDNWYIKKVINEYDTEDTVSYGDKLDNNWNSFLNSYRTYHFSEKSDSEPYKTLNYQITTQYADLISSLVDYLRFNKTIDQISAVYKQSGSEPAKAIIAKIDEKNPDQQSPAGALHGFIIEALNAYYDYNVAANQCLETNSEDGCNELQSTNPESDLAIASQRYTTLANFINEYVNEVLKNLQSLSKEIMQSFSSAITSEQQGESND